MLNISASLENEDRFKKLHHICLAYVRISRANIADFTIHAQHMLKILKHALHKESCEHELYIMKPAIFARDIRTYAKHVCE